MAKFKVGDKVRLLDNAPVNHVCIPIDYFEGNEMIGEVSGVSDFKYTLSGDSVIYEVLTDYNEYDLAEYMLEKVE